MSDEAAAYYQNVFKQVFESDEWQKYRTDKSLYGDFLTGQALVDYWSNERAVHEQMLKNIGEI